LGEIVVYIVICSAALMGCAIIASVCFSWLKNQSLGQGGAVLCLVAVVLIGLPLWKSIKMNYGKEGISVEAEERTTLVS
jgi:hypothetical protein